MQALSIILPDAGGSQITFYKYGLMNTKVGIDAIAYYVPSIYLPIASLAEKRNIVYAKLNKGLGLEKMAVPDTREDAASFAANALLDLIDQNNINPSEIGRIYLGTESALDASKPTCTYAVEAIENTLESKFGPRCFRHCDVLDMTFACVGAVDALHNSLDWVRAGNNRKAIVIASDIAKYELESTGEYTQGAGAVAMLVKEEPSMLSISSEWGVATHSVGDFFKPRRRFNKREVLQNTAEMLGVKLDEAKADELLNSKQSSFWSHANAEFEIFKEEPVFDGPYSNDCYKMRISEALAHFKNQKSVNILKDWQHMVFHLPYAFQARRMVVDNWLGWMKDNNRLHEIHDELGELEPGQEKDWMKRLSKSDIYKKFISDTIEKGERASSIIGNMYTASIFMSLLSLLNCSNDENQDITGQKIGFFSYGSGSKSKLFEAVVEPQWQSQISKSKLFETLESRTPIDIDTYERLHRNEIGHPVSDQEIIRLSGMGNQPENLGLRSYGMES